MSSTRQLSYSLVDFTKMGCVSSRELLEDPSVVLHAEVGATAVNGIFGIGYRVLTTSCYGGHLYVKNGMLCLSGNLFGNTWSLAHIKHICVVNHETVWVFSRNQTVISLSPGIRLTLEDSSGSRDTLIAEMPDAMNFGMKLRDHLQGDVPLTN